MAEHGRQRLDELVGRAREVAELDLALDRLAAGDPWVVQLVGEPGIGKSRLLAELGRRAEQRGYLVLDGRAAEFERDVPLGVIVDALNDYLGGLEPAFLSSLGDDTVAEIASIFPSLSGLTGELGARRVDAERYRAHYAIRAVLERLAARQPLVLALDDVHWADAASIEVIAHVSRRFRRAMLGAFASRHPPAQLAAALDGAARGGFGSRLDIGPLTAADAQALIDPHLDAATRAALYRESGGNPFYLEQLARASRPPGLRAELATEDSGLGWAPPPGVAAAIRDELASLSDDTRLVLDAAAVAGESFEPELVAAIADRPELPVLETFDELLEADLIRPTDAPRRFRFRHPIVRRAVYDGMARAWRLGAHARAAAALAAAHAPAIASAHHVERSAVAGDESAITLLVDAARAASPRAPLTTGRWLGAALALLPAHADHERRLGLLTEAAAAFAAAGAYEESLASWEQALALVPHDQARERAELTVRIADVKQHSIRRFESQALLKHALESLPATKSPTALTVRLELAHDHFWRGDFAQMRELAGGVSAAADWAGPRAILATTLMSLADFYQARLGDALTELVSAEEALATLPDGLLAERMELPAQIGLAACRLERFDEARDHVRRGLRVSRETGQSFIMPALLRVEANALLMKGQLGEAVRVAEAGTEAAFLSGNDRLSMWALEAAALAAYWAGDIDRALANAREAVACAERTAEPFFSGLSRVQLAGALLAGGDPARARTELAALDIDRTRRLLDLCGAHGWALLTEAHLALCELDAAADVAARAEARAEEAPLPQQAAGARCAWAAVMLAHGDARAAVAAGRVAAADFERAGNWLFGARAQVVTGAALAAAGERQAAIARLERAEVVLSTSGAVREAAAAARELRRLGRRITHRRPATPRSGLAALSLREREVADHVASGETNRQVAAALFLSEKTIESHLARIYNKLGVRSRVAVAAIIARGERSGDLGASGGAAGHELPGR